jgi:sugar phosphate isomerase/epimerase
MRLGVKAALGDATAMAGLDVEFLEVHLGIDDLPRRRDPLVATFGRIRRERGLGMVVHAPEFMGTAAHPVLVDLASPDDAVRRLSVGLLERTLDLAQALEASLVVAHPGGIVPPGMVLGAGRSDGDGVGIGVEVGVGIGVGKEVGNGVGVGVGHRAGSGVGRLRGSLERLRDVATEADVAITVENMPWFYNVKAGEGTPGTGASERWESTLLVGPEGFDPLMDVVDGLTLDVSHGYLHSPEGGMEAIEGFIARHGRRVMHLHLSDAKPPDHEGLQLGEGSVDVRTVVRAFADRDIGAVPEVIGGHRRDGLGFVRALEVLRAMLDEDA